MESSNPIPIETGTASAAVSSPAAAEDARRRTDPAGFINPYSRNNRIGRILWRAVFSLLYRWTPFFMNPWRVFLLRRFGAKVSTGRIEASATIWAPWLLEAGDQTFVDVNVRLYNPFGIKLGSRVIVSQNAFLCGATHDHADPRYRLRGGPIIIEDDCWVAADAFIGPGIRIGRGSVVGARAVVVKDVPAWSVVAGNPARVIKARTLRSGEGEA